MYIPCGHCTHDLVNTLGDAEPGGQSWHCSEFMSEAKDPAEQYVHVASSRGSIGRGVGAGGAGGAGGGCKAPSGGGGDGLVQGGGGGGEGGEGGCGGGAGGFATIASLSIVNRYVSLNCPFGDVVINRITLSPWFNVKYFIFTRLAASNRRRALRVVVMDVVDCRN